MEDRRTRRHRPRSWLWAGAVAAAVACACGGGGGGSSCDGPPAIAGPWSGVLSDSSAGGGVLDLEFDQSDCALGGTWQASFADPSFDGSGTLTGSVDGSGLTVSLLTETPGSCNYRATGNLQGTSEIAGSYSTFGTSCSRGGTFDVLSQATPTAQPTATADPTATASPTPTP